jgi:colanic acid/amylovoran biosynthesis glycosyltransferase
MTHPFAVFSPLLGARSETFVRRHVRDLLPGRTVAVTYSSHDTSASDWTWQGPCLDLDSLRPTFLRRLFRIRRPWASLILADHLDPVRRFLRRHKVQVMMGEYLDESLPWCLLARELGIRFFAHAHGYDVSAQLRSPLWQESYLAYNDAAGVITVSDFSRTRLLALGISRDLVRTVPCGVDVPDTPTARSPGRSIRCLAVGRMVPKKAPLLALDAFRRAATRYPDIRLDYVGSGALLGPARQYLEDHELTGIVTLHGGLPNQAVQQMMQSSDIFIQHSVVDPDTGDEEGLPVAILEAMASALPVVATKHAGIPEAVVDGSTGFLVDEGDTEAMADRIELLARSPNVRQQMGISGWTRARDRFSWQRERAALLGILGVR